MTGHLKQNRKDNSTKRSLVRLVGKRKRALSYIAKKDINQYRELIKTLGLRK
ncbi:UNVERIFIED_CONTAM: hypothetical protein GTU68_048931 [Idotea baltica]|nr:hypothetical protein [Idotea baltica]